ncbi:MAG TPA: ABC transporter permease [Gemmatimonadales bacterium]|jgi:predicted permease
MDTFAQDVRFALRQLLRSPLFALTVLATLAIAIGSVTAVFGIVNGVLLNPLGFSRPDRLVYLEGLDPQGHPMDMSPQDLLDVQSQSHSFTAIAAVRESNSLTLSRANAPAERISAARVGGSFFSILGVRAQQGRFFQNGADLKGAPRVVVLSDPAWHRDFGGDIHVIGKSIDLDGHPYQVVGIAPPGFTFPGTPDAWYPAAWDDWEVGDNARGLHEIHAIARLADGVPVAAAQRDLGIIAHRIAAEWPRYDARIGATATPLRDEIIGDVERPLWILMGAVALVLLIACANISNLLLVRAARRESEIAVRTALGAGRRRLALQFITEALVLAIGGAALGLLVASWALALVVRFGPADLPRLSEIAIDGRVFIFSSIIAVLVGLAFGVLPALRASRAEVASMMRAGAGGVIRGARATRSAMVISEFALCTVLLVAAGLLIRSFNRLMAVDPGFRADHVVVFDAALDGPKYQYDPATNAFVDAIIARLAALPGTVGAAAAANRPFDTDPGFSASTSFLIDGQPKPPEGQRPESRLLPVSPGYFSTMGMTSVRGRVFTDPDNRVSAPPVVVVNQALVDRYFPGTDPIGKHITFGISHTVSAAPGETVRARGEIIGVVRTVQHSSLSAPAEPATYFPYDVLPAGPAFVIRTNADPATVEREARAQVAAVDPDVAVYGLQTLDNAVSASVARPRFYALVCTLFAAAALLLAVVGLYGVMAYSVAQRRREFGIRMALGATSWNVISLVVWTGARLIATGLVLGLVGPVLATRLLVGLLFGAQPLDPATFGSVAIILGGAATLACWLPARRAARADPIAALRAE